MKSNLEFNVLIEGKEEKVLRTCKIPCGLTTVNSNTSMVTRNAKIPSMVTRIALYKIVFYLQDS